MARVVTGRRAIVAVAVVLFLLLGQTVRQRLWGAAGCTGQNGCGNPGTEGATGGGGATVGDGGTAGGGGVTGGGGGTIGGGGTTGGGFGGGGGSSNGGGASSGQGCGDPPAAPEGCTYFCTKTCPYSSCILTCDNSSSVGNCTRGDSCSSLGGGGGASSTGGGGGGGSSAGGSSSDAGGGGGTDGGGGGGGGGGSSDGNNSSLSCLDGGGGAPLAGWDASVDCPTSICTAGDIHCSVTVRHLGNPSANIMKAKVKLTGAARLTRQSENPDTGRLEPDYLLHRSGYPLPYDPTLLYPRELRWYNVPVSVGQSASGALLFEQGWDSFSAQLRVCVVDNGVERPVYDNTIDIMPPQECGLSVTKTASCDAGSVRYGLSFHMDEATQAAVYDIPEPQSCVPQQEAGWKVTACNVFHSGVWPYPVGTLLGWGVGCGLGPAQLRMPLQNGSGFADFSVQPGSCQTLQNKAKVTFYNFTDTEGVPTRDAEFGGEKWFESNTAAVSPAACAIASAGSSSGQGSGGSAGSSQTGGVSSSGGGSSGSVGSVAGGGGSSSSHATSTSSAAGLSSRAASLGSSVRSSVRSSSSVSSMRSRSSAVSSGPVMVTALCPPAVDECATVGNELCSQDGKACQELGTYPCMVCVFDPTAPITSSVPGQGAAQGAVSLVTQCGNGRLDPSEQCDDGNEAGGDGCSAGCLREIGRPPRVLEGLPSIDMQSCGNGRLDPGEQCDDSNTQSGDGCSGSCWGEVLAAGGIWLPSSLEPGGTQQQGAVQGLDQQFAVDQQLNNSPFAADVATIAIGHAPAGKTGPATVIFMAMGGAGGWAWMRRRRR